MTGFTLYFSEWNTILMILVLCSLVAMAIFIERLIVLRRSEVHTDAFLIRVRQAIAEQNVIEGVRICEETGGAVAQIVQSGLLRYDRSKEEIESFMERTARATIADLERHARFLSIIAHVTPLIGLLGTVIGFIQAFSEMRLSGLMDISTSRVGAAMEYALVTTAAGLIVAIPSLLAYNYLVARIQRIVLEMQLVAAEVVDLLVYAV